MAIDINEFTLPWKPAEACDYIQSQTDNFGVFFDVDRCFELSGILQMENAKISRKCRRLTSNPRLSLNDKQLVINQFQKMGVKPFSLQTDGGQPGLDAKVLDALQASNLYDEEVKELAAMYQKFTSNKRNKGYLEKLCYREHSQALSKLNHRMAVGRPTWSVLNTSRIAASNPGVQGIPRSMGDIVCEPKGYTLVRCDSGQIEPRINFSTYIRDELIMNLIMHYNDAYYGVLHFCLMSEEEERRCRENFQSVFNPIEITTDIKDSRQNIKTLTNAGSYGSSNLGNVNAELADVYDRKIVHHPSRLEFERAVSMAVNRGETTFYGQFGTPVTPGETEKYKVGDKGWKNHVIRCGINNPVQTTASELMLHSVYAAREILSRAKDSHICFYKHDEACFYVSDEDMANGIGDELADITAYNVKGWIPIEADALIGIKKGDYPSYIL